MFLSIIIPAYNEERRLGESLVKIAKFLSAKSYKSEVIIVDDGSIDKTVEVANQYIRDFERDNILFRVIKNPGNCGKGYSVRNGMLQADGEIALFTDADLSSPIEETDKLIEPIVNGGKDVVLGSRALSESIITTHQPLIREMAGRTFNQFMKFVTGLNFQDTQCGFKAFHHKRSLNVFKQQRINGFGFDVEVLYIAKKHGLRIEEMAVSWANAEGTKVGFLSGTRPFYDLLTIRWNDLCGRYTPQALTADAKVIAAPHR